VRKEVHTIMRRGTTLLLLFRTFPQSRRRLVSLPRYGRRSDIAYAVMRSSPSVRARRRFLPSFSEQVDCIKISLHFRTVEVHLFLGESASGGYLLFFFLVFFFLGLFGELELPHKTIGWTLFRLRLESSFFFTPLQGASVTGWDPPPPLRSACPFPSLLLRWCVFSSFFIDKRTSPPPPRGAWKTFTGNSRRPVVSEFFSPFVGGEASLLLPLLLHPRDDANCPLHHCFSHSSLFHV